MDNPSDPVKSEFGHALISEPVTTFLGPISKHLGDALGDVGSIVHFYSRRNLAKIFKKWAEAERSGKSLEEDEFERVMPLLPLAAQVSDDELQDRWAALFESAAIQREGYLPSFGQTLSQLTAEEAKYLDKLYSVISKPKPYVTEHRPERVPMDRSYLLRIYDPSLITGINHVERQIYKDRFSDEQIAGLARLDHAELIVEDIERLGIFEKEQVSEPDGYFQVPNMVGNYSMFDQLSGKHLPYYRRKAMTESMFTLSVYGLSFIHAVTPKKPDESS